MKKLIKLIKAGVINFFEGNLNELKSIQSLRAVLGLYSLEMSELGASAINEKYKCKYSYLVAADKEESEMIIFVCRWSLYEHDEILAMYCVLGDSVLEYQEGGRNFFSKDAWKGEVGTKMIKAAINFQKGEASELLVGVKEGIGPDIVEFTRNLSLS